MFKRKPEKKIVTNLTVLAGKPVIKGTRIPVELILKLLAQGIAVEEILEEYPRLERADILGAIDYARKAVHSEEVYELQPA